MRKLVLIIALFVTILLSACDFWPKDLKPLAETISRQVSGEATAWLVGGDMVVIDVANSPFFRVDQTELESVTTDMAAQAMEQNPGALESIAITFHEGQISDDPTKMREFIFLVMENRPVLQSIPDFDASGSLTADEIQAALDRMGESLTGEYKACVRQETEARARAAGDPETLDPATIEMLPTGPWSQLDTYSRRLFLTQALISKALFTCAEKSASVASGLQD